ncbi:MAG TPA: signal peptidase I [Candidatus Limnocylindrales bacterium]|nr:signal peptidase I [Candidatus Limnocylindrales bacterium]
MTLIAGGLLLALAGSVSWILTNLRIAVVTGHSMYPTLRDHDRVLVRRTRRPRRGDIVLAAMPTRTGWIVKRVAALPGDPAPAELGELAGRRVPAGMLVLLGDNPLASADSRDFGYVPAERLFGTLLRKL